ncbi:chitosanase [Amycolatopsis sp. K13G38]|uniref:Chitosanase n=1 Tax=Amycolatopsis acididurans TaxID=2724524 RepID=A0ABX1JC66_9PSEU|nr:chitosanase [Amycolatopsis acididurans]NKQ56011.1 chitosanase [Amycolatopsis acididurans]
MAPAPHSPTGWDRRRFLLAPVLAAAALCAASCSNTGKPAAAALRCAPTEGSSAEMDATTKEIAQRLVSSAENSSLDWRAQYGYIEDIGDGRGYTAGIIGFTTGTGDLLDVVNRYARLAPGTALTRLVPALQRVRGGSSHQGLNDLPAAWRGAAADPLFQRAQNEERDQVYFDPAVARARADGLRPLGQFCYYDAIVVHGPGDDADSFGGIRQAALRLARPPAGGGDETAYLNAFLDVRRQVMRKEEAHADTSRIDTAQRRFLREGNLDLRPPLRWSVYGDDYELTCL